MTTPYDTIDKAALFQQLREFDFSEGTFKNQLERVPLLFWHTLLVVAAGSKNYQTLSDATEILMELTGRLNHRLSPGVELRDWVPSDQLYKYFVVLFSMRRMELEGKISVDWPDRIEDAGLLLSGPPNPRIRITEIGKRAHLHLQQKVAGIRHRN